MRTFGGRRRKSNTYQAGCAKLTEKCFQERDGPKVNLERPDYRPPSPALIQVQPRTQLKVNSFDPGQTLSALLGISSVDRSFQTLFVTAQTCQRKYEECQQSQRDDSFLLGGRCESLVFWTLKVFNGVLYQQECIHITYTLSALFCQLIFLKICMFQI